MAMNESADIEKVDLTEQIAQLNAETERLQHRIDELGKADPHKDAESASESVMESVAELRKIARRLRYVA